MNMKELRKHVPNATKQTWHQHANGGGWVKNGVEVPANIYVGPRAIIHGGHFWGGAYYAGDWRGSCRDDGGKVR